MKELLIGIILLSLGGLTGYAYRNPKNYIAVAIVLGICATFAVFMNSFYLLGKSQGGEYHLGIEYVYSIIMYLIFIIYLWSLFYIHKLKD